MLWQWVIHLPGLSVSKSTSTVCLGRHQHGVLAGPRTVAAHHLERVPVQVDRVEHHGLVDHSHPHPLIALDADAVLRRVIEPAVERPRVAASPDRSTVASITWSGVRAGSVTSGVGDRVAVSSAISLRTASTKSSTFTALGVSPTRMFSWAWPCLPSGTATTGTDLSTVNVASTRSPIPRMTDFARGASPDSRRWR